jgi:hypothetical protein
MYQKQNPYQIKCERKIFNVQCVLHVTNSKVPPNEHLKIVALFDQPHLHATLYP